MMQSTQNQFDTISIAQHHGLPTRLLDWTSSPLVALYFCVRSLAQEDGCIYTFEVLLLA